MGVAVFSIGVSILILVVAAIIIIGSLTAGITLVTKGLVKRHKNGGIFPDGVKTKFGVGVGLTAFSLSVLIILGFSVIYINVRNSNSLFYQAVSGTVDDMQRLLDKGVPADCSAKNYWNKPAEGTDLTILGYLTITYSGNEEEKRQYREKMQLLIDRGVDVNRKMAIFRIPSE